MPPALEPDFEQAEAICVDAGQHGSFTPQQSEWIEAFYKNVEDRMLNIYDGARLRAWRINSRQELAAFWQEQAGWFDQMLGRMQEARKKLRGFCVTEPAALRSLIETLNELVAACRGGPAAPCLRLKLVPKKVELGSGVAAQSLPSGAQLQRQPVPQSAEPP